MILLTVYGQMVFKWQAMGLGAFPAGWAERGLFLLRILFNPWIVSSYAAALLASLFWLAALRRLDLSYAYPFTSLAFVLVLILSAIFFHEAVTAPKVAGLILILIGIIVASRG